MFLVVVSVGHSAAGDVDFHSTTDMVDAAGLGCAEDTDHNSPDWVVPSTSAGNLTKDWCADRCYF